MSNEKKSPLALPTEEIVGSTNGIVMALEDRVLLEVPDFGRLEFPPDVAEQVAAALLEGARIVRRDRPKKLVTIV